MSDVIADRVLDRMLPVRLGPPMWLRIVLAVAALAQIGGAVPWLVGTDPLGLLGDATASHLTRDGAFGVVIGLAGLITAWRPRFAVSAAIFSGAVVVLQLTTGLIDGHFHRVALWVEAVHLSTLLITGLVAVASRPARSFPVPTPVKESAGLHLVPGSSDD